MLKGIPEIIEPELLFVLASLGHGDELAIVDRNYPAESTGQRVVYLRGVDVIQAAEAIFRLLPIDTFVEEPIVRMQVVDDPGEVPEVQQAFVQEAVRAEGRSIAIGSLPRFEFYERVRDAFAVVATSESRPYGCFLVTTGVV
ncbi:MAG: RbsD/FucU family protein [Actinomycetota bacterium]